MLEVEAKYRLSDRTLVEASLRAWGAVEVANHAEADHYMNAPDRDFARTDEALRLRQIGTTQLSDLQRPTTGRGLENQDRSGSRVSGRFCSRRSVLESLSTFGVSSDGDRAQTATDL